MKSLFTSSAALLLPFLLYGQTEICNNGIDDDGDGLIDLNDPDCPCSTILTDPDVASYIRNHSFEEQSCCPFGFVSPPFTPPWLDCATGWHQSTVATSDYFHMCGYHPEGFNLPPPDGEGAVGFFTSPTWMEYVGTCLTWPEPAQPLLAGVTYTISVWISASVTNGTHTHSQARGSYVDPFSDQLPLAIFGLANQCVPFPIQTTACIGYEPGWNELGRVYVQPAWDWQRVSITFTPAQDIHSIIIGGACDTPTSLSSQMITNPNTGETYEGSIYFMVDELLLTIAGDQVLLPVTTNGTLCTEDAVAVGEPPAGASNFQWYRNGVALVGETGITLDISGGGYGGGQYVLSCQVNGECLMGNAYMPEAVEPNPVLIIEPAEGCAPLQVALSDTTAGAQTVLWDLGDGTTSTDSSLTHTYTVPGTYDVSLTVRNNAGCTGDTMITHAVTVHPGPSAGIEVSPNPVLLENPVATITGSGSSNIDAWWWDLGSADPPTANSSMVVATFPSDTGSYEVMLVVTTDEGCTDTLYTTVTVIDPGPIAMPNVFSPNNDGLNDRFIPYEAWNASGRLDIYNRWGQMLFTTHNLQQGWNGKDAPDGTYYYVVTPDNPNYSKAAGHFTLIR